jgi:flagellar basal-body rod modification protein FlgD
MAAMAGLLNNRMTAGQALTGSGANPMTASPAATSGTSSSSSSGSSSATISANDFLSLLVTEMQNQDPTADTDPNEYINQLVQVNSLEQLIDINQNLTTALGSSGSTSGTSSTAGQAA